MSFHNSGALKEKALSPLVLDFALGAARKFLSKDLKQVDKGRVAQRCNLRPGHEVL